MQTPNLNFSRSGGPALLAEFDKQRAGMDAKFNNAYANFLLEPNTMEAIVERSGGANYVDPDLVRSSCCYCC